MKNTHNQNTEFSLAAEKCASIFCLNARKTDVFNTINDENVYEIYKETLLFLETYKNKLTTTKFSISENESLFLIEFINNQLLIINKFSSDDKYNKDKKENENKISELLKKWCFNANYKKDSQEVVNEKLLWVTAILETLNEILYYSNEKVSFYRKDLLPIVNLSLTHANNLKRSLMNQEESEKSIKIAKGFAKKVSSSSPITIAQTNNIKKMYHNNLREEELKNRVAQDYFPSFDCTKIIGNIDFCVAERKLQQSLLEEQSLLWAEAKQGNKNDIYKSFVQLILTIGKARTFDTYLPPAFLAAFDAEKIAFLPYNEVQDFFYQNDFNWNVTPSNHETKEFQQIYGKAKNVIETNAFLFHFGNDDAELQEFIKENLTAGKTETTKIRIDKNNFMIIYNKWLVTVKPTITINWETAKAKSIIDGDFYLADLLSLENKTLKEKLYVLLNEDRYELDRVIDEAGFLQTKTAFFKDKQKAHTQFWQKYERPPKEEYWDYIVNHRHLLVPQDVRERKGSFFTPQIWVELSQKYLADTLGEDWQDEYYIWDCAAGTGNLLAGLTNKYHIWASTLDRQDVDVIHDRIDTMNENSLTGQGANLLPEHVFQFDFLNDDFSKLPKSLLEVINDPELRQKLVIYINPPYAEATTAKTVSKTGANKAGVSKSHKVNEQYKAKIGNASNEMFALFMAKIYDKLPSAKLAQFSKMKFVQGSNFKVFRNFFLAKYLGGFIVPASSFDNVTGKFPIGFTIWDLDIKEKIDKVDCDIISNHKNKVVKKTFLGDLPKSINKWIKLFVDTNNNQQYLGFIGNPAPDFQHNNQMYLSLKKGIEHFYFWAFTRNNIIEGAIYFTVRQVITPTWLNDRDQFLYPNDKWKTDVEFQNDCFSYTLFHGQNRVSSEDGVNHWIPFREREVDSKELFSSNFMWQFINGKLKANNNASLLENATPSRTMPLVFSPESQAVFAAGLELWKYYHAKIKETSFWEESGDVNASLYDIRAYFQGRNGKGKMNNKSEDETYNKLIGDLREKLNILAEKIAPKVYEYGFLKS